MQHFGYGKFYNSFKILNSIILFFAKLMISDAFENTSRQEP